MSSSNETIRVYLKSNPVSSDQSVVPLPDAESADSLPSIAEPPPTTTSALASSLASTTPALSSNPEFSPTALTSQPTSQPRPTRRDLLASPLSTGVPSVATSVSPAPKPSSVSKSPPPPKSAASSSVAALAAPPKASGSHPILKKQYFAHSSNAVKASPEVPSKVGATPSGLALDNLDVFLFFLLVAAPLF